MFHLFPTFTVYLCAPCTLIPISTLSAYAMFALSPTALTVLRKYNFLSSVLLMFKFLSFYALFVIQFSIFVFWCFVCKKIFFFFLVLCLLFVWRMLCLFPISYICLLKLCSLLNCQFFPFFLLKLCFSELSVSAFLVQANFLLLFANTLHVTHFSHFVSQCFCCEFF